MIRNNNTAIFTLVLVVFFCFGIVFEQFNLGTLLSPPPRRNNNKHFSCYSRNCITLPVLLLFLNVVFGYNVFFVKKYLVFNSQTYYSVCALCDFSTQSFTLNFVTFFCADGIMSGVELKRKRNEKFFKILTSDIIKGVAGETANIVTKWSALPRLNVVKILIFN